MVHESAALGYSQDDQTYASARPSYHPQVIDAVVAAIVAAGGGRRVADLGAGTGIATAALASRGLPVVAVEPVEAMRRQLAAAVSVFASGSGAQSSVEVVDSTAESIPLPDHAVDAVVVAQAFHWFDHRPALDEIVRVLDPRGLLVTLWNARDESVPWMAAYTAIQDREQGDTPRYRDMEWRHAIEADDRFALADEIRVPNPQPSDAEHAVARFLSTSFIAKLPESRRAELSDEIRSLVDDLGPAFDFPYVTEAQIWQRTA